jgi:putative hydrolase of HD superfamily
MSEELSDDVHSLLRFFSRAERLERFPRTGWLASGVQQPESVAAHSWEVTVVALWLADAVEAEVDAERVLRIALLHDIGESVLTDLPRPVKELVGSETVEEAEARATERVLEGAGEEWGRAVEAYREQASDEARLVKAADRIQMMAKALSYDAQDRGDVSRFWESRDPFDDRGFPLVGEIFEALREKWEAGEWYDQDFR